MKPPRRPWSRGDRRLGAQPVKSPLLRLRHRFFRRRAKQPEVGIDDVGTIGVLTCHDLPLVRPKPDTATEEEARSNVRRRARDRYRLTAIVPRDVPSSFAICASLKS